MDFSAIKSFGAVDADNDDLLLDCFEDHEAYIAAKAHERYLVIGRKGSGKTAIFRKLVSENTYNKLSRGHSFSDYPWFHHDKQKKTGVPEAECFRYSWEYVILISLAKMIVESGLDIQSDEALEAISRLETFLIDTYGSTSPALNRIFSPETRLKLKPSLTAGWSGVKAGISAETIEINHLPTIIYEVNDALLETVIRCLDSDIDYHICFDELDRGFVAGDENYRQRLSGLLIAARDFNRRLRRSGKRASIVIFLRDDILRHLKFEDQSKLVEDFASLIEWDKPSTGTSLKNIMAKRFSKLFGVPENEAWDLVFDEEQKMPGRQSKYQHILDRTFKRPRDIIKFCNEILRSHKQNGILSGKFENKEIIAARGEHSKYMRKELSNEMQQHFPAESAAFDLIRGVGFISFTLERIKEVHRDYAATGLDLPSHRTILRTLYDFSAIGYLKVGGSGGGSEWVWRYEDTDAEYDERANIFRVHSGLKEVLGLKQGRAVGQGEISVEELRVPDEEEIDA